MKTFVQMPSVDMPFRYFGAKTKAREILAGYVPTSVKEVVSPFLGGGAFELYLTARGIRVHGYDICEPLVGLWKQLLRNPDALSQEVRKQVMSLTPENWGAYQDIRFDTDVERAAQALLTLNFSYNNMGFRMSGCVKFVVEPDGQPFRAQSYLRGRRLIFYERIRNFSNPLLSVGCLDFRESLAKHPDAFVYADPPYPDIGKIYGTAPEHHEEFPHEELAEILHSRRNWVLSYNNCEQIQELYPPSDFHWDFPQWAQNSKRYAFRGNEVIIRPH